MSGYTSTKKIGIDAKQVVCDIFCDIQNLAKEFAGPNPKGEFCLEELSENRAQIVYREKQGLLKKNFEHVIALAENNYHDEILPINGKALITDYLVGALELTMQMAAGRKDFSEEELINLWKKANEIQQKYQQKMDGE